jgi:TRAP-type uncharacterized transport system fused permease subunit
MFGFRPRLLSTIAIAITVAVSSIWLIYRSPSMICARLAPLTILATIAAFLISICFRLMSKFKEKRERWLLFACVLIAATALFADFRFVRHYRDTCDQLQQQLRQMSSPQ